MQALHVEIGAESVVFTGVTGAKHQIFLQTFLVDFLLASKDQNFVFADLSRTVEKPRSYLSELQ
jgi:hypothetical protein